MKKNNCLIFFLLLLTVIGSAQDLIFKKDNSKLSVKIVEIGISDIRYKQADTSQGPLLSIKKEDVSMILFANGKHEVINTKNTQSDGLRAPSGVSDYRLKFRRDSSRYFRYSSSLALNFLNFANNEVGFIFQKEYIKKSFNVIVPISFGIEQPEVTNSTYFSNYVYFNNGNSSFTLTKKIIELGLGINYYPFLRSRVNYYLGPVVKYTRYNTEQNLTFFTGTKSIHLKEYSQMIRYVGAISNGFIIRTTNRVMFNMFMSLGYKYDQVADMIYNPVNNESVDPITKNLSLYFWAGACVGYSF